MRLTTLLLLISISACLAGCGKTTGEFCDVAKPFRPTADAVAAMSDREKADILKHNAYGEEQCGWRP